MLAARRAAARAQELRRGHHGHDLGERVGHARVTRRKGGCSGSAGEMEQRPAVHVDALLPAGAALLKVEPELVTEFCSVVTGRVR